MRRFKSLFFLSLLGLGLGLFMAYHLFYPSQPSPSYYSSHIYVYNITDGKEVLAIKEKEKVAPASLTKMMTVWLALDKIKDLDAKAPIDGDNYAFMKEQEASLAGFAPGESTTYRDLVYGSMLPSGGEAASSLAINLCKKEARFVRAMNWRAFRYGLWDTHFSNAAGLDNVEQRSSAKDMAKLLEKALEDENFRKVFTSKHYQSSGTSYHPTGLWMTSTVLGQADQYPQVGFKILGGKSGTTKEAGLCWATLAEKNGKEYLCVVMGAPRESGDGQIQDTLTILGNL